LEGLLRVSRKRPATAGIFRRTSTVSFGGTLSLQRESQRDGSLDWWPRINSAASKRDRLASAMSLSHLHILGRLWLMPEFVKVHKDALPIFFVAFGFKRSVQITIETQDVLAKLGRRAGKILLR